MARALHDGHTQITRVRPSTAAVLYYFSMRLFSVGGELLANAEFSVFTIKHISVEFIILPHDIHWSLYTSTITIATHLELYAVKFNASYK